MFIKLTLFCNEFDGSEYVLQFWECTFFGQYVVKNQNPTEQHSWTKNMNITHIIYFKLYFNLH